MAFRSTNTKPNNTGLVKNPTTSNAPKPDLRLMTVKEVGKLLRISTASVYRLADSGQIACYRVLRKRLFKYDEVIALVERGMTPRWNQ